jgi:DNA modification methylase
MDSGELSMLLPDGEKYKVVNCDVIPHMFNDMESQSIDTMITSVPFPSVFSYTQFEEDLGNSEDEGEVRIHFGFMFKALLRVMKPGRIACIHCMNMSSLSQRNNRKDIYDFRGLLIRLAKRAGFLYENDWLVFKNPQVEAIRSHAHGLLFVTLERDRAKSRAAMGDYIIKLVAPGDNKVPIDSPGITREEWIDWAAPCWHGIRQTRTLNTKEAKSEKDTRHICPLQLDTINRLIRLFSNPGEIIFDPFTGIGSTAYEAIGLDRRFYGCEIKKEYFDASIKNIKRAIDKKEISSSSLFDFIKDDEPLDSDSDLACAIAEDDD